MTDDQQQAQPPEARVTAFRGASRAEQYVEAPEPIEPLRPVLPAHAVQPAPAAAETADLAAELGAASTSADVAPAPEPAPVPATPEAATGLLAEPLPLADLGTVSRVQKPATATKGFRGALSKIGIRMAPGPAEQRELDAAEQLRIFEEIIRQAVWTRPVSVLVANKKGGVGKTPMSLGLGGVFASVRGGSVAIMEVADDSGALTFRAEGSPSIGLGELVRDVDKIKNAGQLAGYTAPQTSFASVIGTVGHRPQLTYDEVLAVARVVDEFYSIRVMDSGNQPSSSAFRGAVETADVLVIPTYNAGDSILEAIQLLDALRAQGGHAAKLADTAVMLRLQDGRVENHQVVERVDRIVTGARVGQVFTIPYDPHIAERGPITLGHLNPATYWALAAAASGVVRALQSNVR